MNGWQNFYVIVGAAGATLIGVQFVVMTLIATFRSPTDEDTLGAFGTPTVVYFASAIVLAAIMCAPWPSLLGAAIVIGILACGAFVYGIVVIHRARRQTGYEPVKEDWFWYAIAPSATHLALVAASLLLFTIPRSAMFIIAAASLALLLIGVHNAWDTVTYIVLNHHRKDRPE